MKRFIIILLLLQLSFFASGKKISIESRIELSDMVDLYAIAHYCNEYIHRLYVGGDETFCSLDAAWRYVPDGDSVGFYGYDDFHNDSYKPFRSMIHSNWNDLKKYIKKGSHFFNIGGTPDILEHDMYSYKFCDGSIERDNTLHIRLNNPIMADSCAKWLCDFERNFMNESIHQEITRIRKAYLDSLPFNPTLPPYNV